jgi:teichuronic acid biosynthesis glycosyltransferase TuaG
MEVVDVVITTFNETSRLFRAVTSVKKQSFKVNKIWIVDDGSTDSVVEEMRSTFNKDVEVELVLLEHSGTPGISRKTGVLKSSAEWIAFLDADDYWHPEKIEKQLKEASACDGHFVFTNAYKIRDHSLESYFPKISFRRNLKFRHMIKENKIVNSSVLVRRRYLHLVDIYADLINVRAVEDYATWLRLSSITQFVGLSEELTYYSVSGDSLSRESNIDKRLFALVDFLIWSLKHKSITASTGIRQLICRVLVACQIVRETLIPTISNRLGS